MNYIIHTQAEIYRRILQNYSGLSNFTADYRGLSNKAKIMYSLI